MNTFYDAIAPDFIRSLRTMIQDSHLNFLIGAGTPSDMFSTLGDVETVLTELENYRDENPGAVRHIRASIQWYFFQHVLRPNLNFFKKPHSEKTAQVVDAYSSFLTTINSILLRRRNTLLPKQANIFTSNVDLAFEYALEQTKIDYNDGFSGTFNPQLDHNDFGTTKFRQGRQFGYQSEVPLVNLFKIHGSASWKHDKNEIFLDAELSQIKHLNEKFNTDEARQSFIPIQSAEEVNTQELLTKAKRFECDTELAFEFSAKYEKLSIVNPEKTKFAITVLNQQYYELIRHFANELEKENSLLFVHGFSFRDEHFRNLVIRAALSNPTLQVFVICYDSQAHSELRNLIPKKKFKNQNLMLISPLNFQVISEIEEFGLDSFVNKILRPVVLPELSQENLNTK